MSYLIILSIFQAENVNVALTYMSSSNIGKVSLDSTYLSESVPHVSRYYPLCRPWKYPITDVGTIKEGPNFNLLHIVNLLPARASKTNHTS